MSRKESSSSQIRNDSQAGKRNKRLSTWPKVWFQSRRRSLPAPTHAASRQWPAPAPIPATDPPQTNPGRASSADLVPIALKTSPCRCTAAVVPQTCHREPRPQPERAWSAVEARHSRSRRAAGAFCCHRDRPRGRRCELAALAVRCTVRLRFGEVKIGA